MREGSTRLALSLMYYCLNFSSVVVGACHVALLGLLAASPTFGQSRLAPPSHPTATFATLAAKADAARDADRLDEATALYKKALVLRPGWAEGWWSLGTIAYDQSSYAEAARAFQKATRFAPRNGNAFVMLGLSEFELGRDVSALQHLQKGGNLGLNENVELRRVALYHEGVILQRLGRFQAAQDTLEQLCLQGVRSDNVIQALGMVLLRIRNKNPPPASSLDAEIIAHVGMAACLAGQKKFDEGRAELASVVSQHPTFPNIHYAFGIFLIEASDLASACAEFKQEIKNNPADVVSRLQIAAAMYKIDSAGALLFAEEAVKLAPHQPFGHFLLGLLLLDTDKYQEAIPELEIAQKAFPRESRIYIALGTAYSRAGRKLEAAKARATFARLAAAEKKSSTQDTRSPDPDRIPVGDAAPSSQ